MKKLTSYLPQKTIYRRRLPHRQNENAIYLITFRLAGSLPKSIIEKLKKERISQKERLLKDRFSKEEIQIELTKLSQLYFGKYDELLDNMKGPHYLEKNKFAQIVADSIMYFDNQRYSVVNYCIMSNHVHLILSQLQRELDQILGSIKKFSAREINKMMNTSGQQFWHYENFDHIIRNEWALQRFIHYNLMNPVKAKLVKDWKNWKWNYLREDLVQYAP